METEIEDEEKEGFVHTEDGEYVHEDNTWTCEKTGKVYSDDVDAISVYVTRWSTQEWCQDAADSYAFFCDKSGDYYSNNRFTEIDVEGDTICKENYEDDLYYWDSDGEYHWEEEEEEEEENDIPDYHDEYRPWEEKNFGKELVFGCELELKATDDRVTVKDIANNCNLIAERDGSLCDTYGIEIIGPPMKLEEYSSNSNWMKFLEKVNGEAKGWDAGKGYGMHISINRKALSDFHTGKLLVFIHSNEELCEKIAGRGATEYQTYVDKKIPHGKLYYGDKYEALAIRDRNRLECRIFRSTLKPSSFLKNLEFVAAAIEFTRFASCENLTSGNFKSWLKKNTSQYKNLAKSLGMIKTNPKNVGENEQDS